ncbi:MAG: DUF4129 domain-containing protein [Thermosynechococcaceae cyanobacterium]
MELVLMRLAMLGTLALADRANWQGQNLLRRTGEWAELQANRFSDLLTSPDLPLFETPNWLEPRLILVVKGVALLVAFVLLYWISKAVIGLLRRKRRRSTPVQQTSTRTKTAQDWLAQATAAQAQQEYATACRALYMALLIHLEKMEWLPQNPTLTDQDYLRRLNALWALYPQSAELPPAWTQLIQTHEVLHYGARPASAELFEGCQQSYQQLVTELAPCRPVVP